MQVRTVLAVDAAQIPLVEIHDVTPLLLECREWSRSYTVDRQVHSII